MLLSEPTEQAPPGVNPTAHNKVSDARGPTHVHGFRQTHRLVRTPIMGWTMHVCTQGGVGDTPLPSPQLCYEPKTILKNRHYFGAPWLAQSEERVAHDLGVPRSSPTLCIEIILKTLTIITKTIKLYVSSDMFLFLLYFFNTICGSFWIPKLSSYWVLVNINIIHLIYSIIFISNSMSQLMT